MPKYNDANGRQDERPRSRSPINTEDAAEDAVPGPSSNVQMEADTTYISIEEFRAEMEDCVRRLVSKLGPANTPTQYQTQNIYMALLCVLYIVWLECVGSTLNNENETVQEENDLE